MNHGSQQTDFVSCLLPFKILILILFLLPKMSWATASDGSEINRQLLNLIEACIGKVEGEELGLNLHDHELKLSNDCPMLSSIISDDVLVNHFQPKLKGVVSVTQLYDLYYLLVNMQNSKLDGTRQFKFDRLESILDEVFIPTEGDQTDWLKQFIEWLKEKFSTEEGKQDYEWVLQLIERLLPSEQTVEFIFYGSLISIVLIAIAVFINELRTAGAFRYRRSKRFKQKQIDLPEDTNASQLTLKDIGNLPLNQQPAALLMVCIYLLIGKQHLPRGGAYTNRELLEFLSAGHQQAGESFAYIVNYAERTLYGGDSVKQSELENCFARVHQLIHSSS